MLLFGSKIESVSNVGGGRRSKEEEEEPKEGEKRALTDP